MKKTLVLIFTIITIISVSIIACSATYEGRQDMNTYTNFTKVRFRKGADDYYNFGIDPRFSSTQGLNTDTLIYGKDFSASHKIEPDDYNAEIDAQKSIDRLTIFSEDIEQVTLISDYFWLGNNYDPSISPIIVEVDGYDSQRITSIEIEYDTYKVKLEDTILGTDNKITINSDIEHHSHKWEYNLNDNVYYAIQEIDVLPKDDNYIVLNFTMTINFFQGVDDPNVTQCTIIVESPTEEFETLATMLINTNINERITVSSEAIDFEDVSLISWIGTQVDALLEIELIPNITIGAILWAIVALALLFLMLKIFLGG